jgi:FkbM family methyltransferase
MGFQDLIGHDLPLIHVVDVGAMQEGQDRYHKLVASAPVQVTGFEPNPAEFAKLRDRPGPYRYLDKFLGGGGAATFHVTYYPGCSSLFEPDPGVIDLFDTIRASLPTDNFFVETSQTVETTQLDDIDGLEIDYIKLDAQGSELDILRHGTSKMASTVVIESEVAFMPLYKGQPLFGDIQLFLRDQGFVLHKLIDCGGRALRPFSQPNRFMPMSQFLWADAIFVRDFTRLDTYRDEGLLKAAAILDLVYSSIDLVALLLAEYDRRRGTNTHDRYIGSLKERYLKQELQLQFLNIKSHV